MRQRRHWTGCHWPQADAAGSSDWAFDLGGGLSSLALFFAFPTLTMHCYAHGQIMPADQFRLPFHDLGLLRGYAVFDYLRTYAGRPFLPQSYVTRLERSAQAVGLFLPEPRQALLRALEQLAGLDARSGREIGLRMLLTGGLAADAVTMTAPELLIMSEPLAPQDLEVLAHPNHLLTLDHQRDLPKVKTTNYLRFLSMTQALREAGADDVLYVSGGQVRELSRSNFFVVKDGVLITPDSGILEGITRQVVLRIAARHLRVEVRPCTLAEVLLADEAFATSSTKRIIPVTAIDGQPIGDGQPGPVTQQLHRLFVEFLGQKQIES